MSYLPNRSCVWQGRYNFVVLKQLLILLLFSAIREPLPKSWDGLHVLDSDHVLFPECLKDVAIDLSPCDSLKSVKKGRRMEGQVANGALLRTQ